MYVEVTDRYKYYGDGKPGRLLYVTSETPVTSAEGCNSLVRDISLVDGDDAVYLDNTVDKKAITDKEGVHFGFAFDLKHNCRLYVDVPLGVMELEKDQWPEANRNWLSMQRW